jgi:hypothetical protein
MSAAAATRLTPLHGEPRSTLAGLACARDGTEVPVLPWPGQTAPGTDRTSDLSTESVIWLHNRTANVTFCG